MNVQLFIVNNNQNTSKKWRKSRIIIIYVNFHLIDLFFILTVTHIAFHPSPRNVQKTTIYIIFRLVVYFC